MNQNLSGRRCGTGQILIDEYANLIHVDQEVLRRRIGTLYPEVTVGLDMVGKLGQLPQGETVREQRHDRFHIVAPKECPILGEIEDISKKESRDDLRYGWCGGFNDTSADPG